MRYKGKGGDLKTISIALGVSAVLTGRIAQRGDNLTISVELVDVRNNKLHWGEQYDRKISELLATQREIATEITQKLQLKLSGEGEQKLAKQIYKQQRRLSALSERPLSLEQTRRGEFQESD